MIPLLILVTAASAATCFVVAGRRSADRWFWLLLGLLVGPLAIPFVFFSRPKFPVDESP